MPALSPSSGPARAWDSAARHLSHGFYYITDHEAGLIARANRMHLPALSHGYEARVELPYDGRLAWLSRTPASTWWEVGMEKPPKRGWVWAISGIR